MNKIVITGPTGAIGYALIKKALSQNMKVLAVVRPENRKLDAFRSDDNFSICECDIRNYSDIKIDEKYDAFIHLAWASPFGEERNNEDIQNLNVQYELDAVHLAKRLGCKEFIGAGSQAEYGPHDGNITEKTVPEPVTAYGKAKIKACNEASELCKDLGISFFWTRIFSVYGIGEKSYTLTSACIENFLKNKCPALSPCIQIWDYINSDDTADAFFSILEKGTPGEIYNVASGQYRELRCFVQDIYDDIKPGCDLVFGKGSYYKNQVMSLKADVTKLKGTGWKPETDFKDGIHKLIEYKKATV